MWPEAKRDEKCIPMSTSGGAESVAHLHWPSRLPFTELYELPLDYEINRKGSDRDSATKGSDRATKRWAKSSKYDNEKDK